MIPAKTPVVLAAGLLMVMSVSHADDMPKIDGTWLSGDGDGWIDVIATAEGLSGVIEGSPNADEDRPDTDEKNPDPALRNRPLVGLQLFHGFEYEGDGRWTGGTIYDPNSGKTYRCKVTYIDQNTLKVRGYIGVSLLGRTETWTRLQD
jgi:uncharacterized protein (DUF2147 family)